MKVLVILGVALLCLSQVYGEGDVLKSLFEEKVQNLSREKLAAVEVNDFVCDANELVANGSQIVKNTLDIVQKTFGVAYTLLYPTTAKCPGLSQWRCYIKEFVDTKDSINLVSTNVKEFKEKSSELMNGITTYFQKCAKK